MLTYKFKIERFNPQVDSKPAVKTYTIRLSEGATVLDGLIKIKSDKDGTLSFRRSCRSAICGSCACRVNGKAMLICDLQAGEAAEKGEIFLQPLANFKVIRDLVVDLTPFWNAVEKALPWLVLGDANPPQKEFRVMPNDDFIGLGRVDVCVLCAACHSDCPVLTKHRDWYGPIMNQKTARFLLDARDKDGGRALRAKAAGFELCDKAEKNECPVECPKGINMMEDIFKVIKKSLMQK